MSLKEAMEECSPVEEFGITTEEYKFLVRLGEEKKANASFANTLVSVLCMRNPDKRMKVSCNVIASDDGENHFWCRTNK